MLIHQLLREAVHSDTAVLSFGRFNPPHRGHKLLTDLLVRTAQREHADHALWLKGRVGPKDPLTVDQRTHYLRMLTPGLVCRVDPNLPDPADIVQSYIDRGYAHIILVLGGDRMDKVLHDVQSITQSAGVSLKVLSAGDRSGTEMWSATEQRAAAMDNNFDAFAAGLPSHFPAAREMFDAVRRGL